MRWGTTYRGTARIEDIAEAIEAYAKRIGMVVERETPEEGIMILRAVQKRPWYQVMLFRLSQDIRWELQQSGNRASVTADFRFFRWYKGVIGLFCALTAVLLLYGGRWLAMDMLQTTLQENIGGAISLFISLILLCSVNFYLIGAIGGYHADRFWETIRVHVEKKEQYLEIKGAPGNLRYIIWVFSYLVFVFSLVGVFFFVSGFIRSDFWKGFSEWTIYTLWTRYAFLSAVLSGLLLVAALVFFRMRGFSGSRLVPIIPGMWTLLAAMFFLCAPCPWLMQIGQDAEEAARVCKEISIRWDARTASFGAVEDDRGLASSVNKNLARAISLLRLFVWLFMFGSVLFSSVAVVFLLRSVNVSLRVQPYLVRISRFPEKISSRRTTSGWRFMVWFRFFVGGCWMILSSIVLSGVVVSGGFLLAIVMGASRPGWLSTPAHIVDASVAMVVVALGQPVSSVLVQAGVRLCWVFYSFIALGALVLSLASFFRSRQAVLRRIEEARPFEAAERERVQNILRPLSGRAGMKCPTVVISPEKVPGARAHRFGLFKRSHWIEVSSGAMRLLQAPERVLELEALLAHELGHHKAGHCLSDTLFRFLGRLTFVGDGFVRTLLNTSDWEVKADEIAVRQCGVDPLAFKHLLWRMGNVLGADVESSLLTASGLDALPIPRSDYAKYLLEGPKALAFRKRWALAWKCYLNYYTGRDRTAYWHPVTKSRLERIETFTRPLEQSIAENRP